ncbi:hypothetical protein ZOSMA_469G00010 [Zostera marina]|uniref:Nucleoporin Nup133/Nup155-like N-terminal domain-containing protein n=1 Tax=Zostera marina TaxID=29655 RepID=A0A0K9P2B8_ZOSMR|nr:hypothetical protein ZOSMA_469G00010 [Zostera marina]
MDIPHLLEEAIIWHGRTRFLVQTWFPLVSMSVTISAEMPPGFLIWKRVWRRRGAPVIPIFPTPRRFSESEIKYWPPIAEVVGTRELPPVLNERYNAAGGEGTTLCRIFPVIRRAWASVDNSLFLWRFDKWSFYGSICSII